MTRTPLLALAALAMLLPAPSQAQQVPPLSEQRIRPGDVVRLEIWREEDWSGEFEVDEAGSVVFARVGEYIVTDETPASLQAKLLAQFSRYLRQPIVDVTVLRRISVTGAVNDPGIKLIEPTMSIVDVVALAGGATQLGEPDKVRIVRDGMEIDFDLGVSTSLGNAPIQSGDQLFVPERSWVSRNANVVAAGIAATASLVIAIFIR